MADTANAGQIQGSGIGRPGLLQKIRGNPNERYEEIYHKAKTARLPFDKECWLNMAFFLGEQYVEWMDSLNTVRRIEKPQDMEHLPRPVSNKIQHFVLQQHNHTMQIEPTVDVLPANEDPANISAANVCMSYLDWLADEQVANWEQELAIASLWALAGTEGFIKSTWNPRLCDGKGRGDFMACSPLDIFPDPYAKSFSKCRYVIHSQFMDVENVYDIYGIEIPPQSIEKTDPVRIALMREMGMAPTLQGALVHEMWMKPNRRYPEGMFVTWAGKYTLVEACPYPYKHGRLPFAQIGSVLRPGTQHYTSRVSSLRTPQMELNKFHAQMIQIREAFSNPKWWIPTELDLENDPDDSPRQILRGDSNGGQLKPEIIAPSMMPPNDAGAWIANEMMDIVGVHDVSQAQVPGRVEAAKAIELLQETDDGALREMRRTIRTAISELFYQQLMLVQQYGDEKNVFMSYSREGFPEVHQLMKTQIDPGMRIHVTMGTGLSTSRAAREDQLMTLWDNGIIQDREIMAELMDLPVSSISPDNMFDIKLARNENLVIAGGQPITPSSWDNHDIHRREHNNFRKTMDYRVLGNREKAAFEMHVTMHDQLQIQQLGKQLQIQQMAAAVASGAGFQQPPPATGPGAPGSSTPSSSAPPGTAQPGGAGASTDVTHNQMPGMPGVIPTAAGAQGPPSGPDVPRATPQAQASYQNRYANSLTPKGK